MDDATARTKVEAGAGTTARLETLVAGMPIPFGGDRVALVSDALAAAFQAGDRAMVEAFYQAGLAAGGRDNGAPGERPYHPGYYAAFLLDPDGNNIEAVYHGEARRSAPSVEIAF